MVEGQEQLVKQGPLELAYPYPYSSNYPTAPENKDLINKMMRELRIKAGPLRFVLAGKEITKALEIKQNEKILEIGSGLGLLGERIKKAVGGDLKYFGVDLFLSSTKSSREKSIVSTQTDAISLPFAKESFDKVISTDVLEHISDGEKAVEEIYRVMKPGGTAFVVIADPSEGRFAMIPDHIRRTEDGSDVRWWANLFEKKGFNLLSKESSKYRSRDWRKIFNLPFLVKFKDKPGCACAFNPIHRPGVYILEKPGVET